MDVGQWKSSSSLLLSQRSRRFANRPFVKCPFGFNSPALNMTWFATSLALCLPLEGSAEYGGSIVWTLGGSSDNWAVLCWRKGNVLPESPNRSKYRLVWHNWVVDVSWKDCWLVRKGFYDVKTMYKICVTQKSAFFSFLSLLLVTSLPPLSRK